MQVIDIVRHAGLDLQVQYDYSPPLPEVREAGSGLTVSPAEDLAVDIEKVSLGPFDITQLIEDQLPIIEEVLCHAARNNL